MQTTCESLPTPEQHLVVIRPEPQGRYTAQVVGIPDLQVTASTEQEALEQVRRKIAEQLYDARWVRVAVGSADQVKASRPPFAGMLDPSDPLEQAYLRELARQREADLELTLKEDEQGCSATSSTPTT
jgi:hypothetical protein